MKAKGDDAEKPKRARESVKKVNDEMKEMKKRNSALEQEAKQTQRASKSREQEYLNVKQLADFRELELLQIQEDLTVAEWRCAEFELGDAASLLSRALGKAQKKMAEMEAKIKAIGGSSSHPKPRLRERQRKRKKAEGSSTRDQERRERDRKEPMWVSIELPQVDVAHFWAGTR